MSITELPASQLPAEAHFTSAGRTQLADDHDTTATHPLSVVGIPLGSDQAPTGPQRNHVAVDLPPDQERVDDQSCRVGGSLGSSDQRENDAQRGSVAAVELQFSAAFLDDVERLRIATENRVRSFEQAGHSAAPYLPQLDALKHMEHQATLQLGRVIRKHPLGPWIKLTIGVGEKQGARLIAALDDPAYNFAEDRPRRGPAELWAYCGFAPSQKRRKGVKSNWNAQAKMRAFLIAESCLKAKARSPYGPVYDAARVSWQDKDTSDAHKHNHALRVVAKAVLKDLFLEAKRVAEEEK